MADLILPASLAVWDPLGGTLEPVMTGHDGICIHTMAGSFAGTDSMFHDNGWGGTESTVGIAGSGFCKQWVQWNRQADANLEGNARWLSIECADAGENFPPVSQATDENPPLTAAQINKIVDLCVYWCDVRNHANCPTTWTCRQSGIPARWINNSCERGIGVHRHGIPGFPEYSSGCPKWSSSGGKICPRSVRLRQVRDLVVPRVAAALNNTGDDELNDTEKAQLANIDKVANVLWFAINMEGQATKWKGNFPGRVDAIYDTKLPQITADLDALAVKLDELSAKVDALVPPPAEPPTV
jgi:hypothetical protein